jgi:hypothetical protein
MLRTNRPAVSSSSFVKINGAMTPEKKAIDPNSVATDTRPAR